MCLFLTPSFDNIVKDFKSHFALSAWYYQNIECYGKLLHEDGNPSRANIKQALGCELTDRFGKPFDRTGKYGDFCGYTSVDMILYIWIILSRRFLLKMNIPIQDQGKMEMEKPRSSGVSSLTQCSQLNCFQEDK
ncbi:hypothetical protein Tco_0425436 [Tanacetum coccineum]